MRLGDPRGRLLTRLAMAATAIGLFLASYYWGGQYRHRDSVPPAIEGVLVRPPPELPGIELRDETGRPFTGEDFARHWTLLSFADASQASGHLAVTRMIEVRNRLASDPDLQEMLLLALADERQEPAFARDFGRLSPAIKLLSGEPDEMQRLRASLGAPAQEPSGMPADEVPFYLIGPANQLLALFPGAQAPASIASDLSAIAAHSHSLNPAHD